MNDTDRQVLRTAAERLLAVADGATLEYADGSTMPHAANEYDVYTIGGDNVRIRPPSAPTKPKPSQEWPPKPADAQLREWGKVVAEDKPRVPEIGDTFMCYCGGSEWGIATATESYDANVVTFGGLRWILKDAPAPESPCQPLPTPWELDPAHAGKVIEHRDGMGHWRIESVSNTHFFIPFWGKVTPAELLRDWTHLGKPCGDVAK